jgi:hypothetical protein
MTEIESAVRPTVSTDALLDAVDAHRALGAETDADDVEAWLAAHRTGYRSMRG